MITGQACSEEKMVLRFLKEKSHYTHRCGKSYKYPHPLLIIS